MPRIHSEEGLIKINLLGNGWIEIYYIGISEI